MVGAMKIINLGDHNFLGDALAGASAAIHLDCEICNPPFNNLLMLYSDLKVIQDATSNGEYIGRVVNGHLAENDANHNFNYVGVMMAAAGELPVKPPVIISPSVELLPQLVGINYAVLQPICGTAHDSDLSISDLEIIVELLKSKYGLATVISGKSKIIRPNGEVYLVPVNIDGAIYCFGDAINYLRVVSGAKLVLGATSAVAQIAAGYNVPAVIWMNQRRLNTLSWHWNYPGWDKILCLNTIEDVIAGVKRLRALEV